MIELTAIQAGDSYTYTLPDEINITTGFTAHLSLSSKSNVYDFTFSDRVLTIADTSTLVPNLYIATLYEFDGTTRHKIDTGHVNVLADYTKVAAKSKNEIRLALIEAEITRRETGGDASYSQSGTSITKIDYSALCRERDRLQEIVWAEIKNQNRQLGKHGNPPIIFVQ